MTDRTPPQPTALCYRSMSLECEPGKEPATRADGSADTRIPVAISSETMKVERYDWWTDERYIEVLDHAPESVDMSYAADGLPFLLDHESRLQVGILEDVRVSPDRKIRGMLRMGSHPDASWVEKDIRSGVRKKVSAGYQLGQYKVEGERDGLPVRRYRWRPVEASSVPIPADYDVGVGRSADALTTRGAPMSDDHKPGEAAVTLGDQRQEIASITRLAAEHGMVEHLAGWLERGLNLDRVRAEILERKRANPARPMDVPGYLDLSPRDARDYTAWFGRTLVALADRREPDGPVWEGSKAIAKRGNRTSPGIFVPLDLQTRTSLTGNVVGTSSLGGAGVQTSVLSLIDLLRNKMLVRQAGATVLSGLTGNITFPRHIVPNTMAWEGENPSTPHAHTAATFDNVTLSPKSAMASTAYSRQFLTQASFDASAFVQNDLAAVLAVGIDLAALDGTGSNNQPTGIMRQTGVISITHGGSNGGIPTWAELVSYETNIATNNGDVGDMSWITTPGVRGKLKTVIKTTTAGSTFLWETDNTINGYPAFATANMPGNFTFGTSTTIAHGAVFGVWSEVLIGEWGGALEVIVDPFTSASQNMINVTAIAMVDVGLRRPKALAVTKSALIA